MKKSTLLILILFAIYSCNKDDTPQNEISQELPEIPEPVIIGEENKGCVANIIFLAEGFRNSEMAEFKNLCNIAKQTILELEPFASSTNNLNFYRVDSPSITSGIGSRKFTSVCNETTGVDKSTISPWSVFSNRIGLQRYAGMDSSNRDSLEEFYGEYAKGDYAYTIIIVNTTGDYAGAELPGVTEYNTITDPKISNMIVSKNDSDNRFKYLIRHEFGHSFGNLDDEYEDSSSNCAINNYEGWSISTIPKENVLTYNPGGWFEGARYTSTGYWREWENSIMRNDYFSTTFSPIQESIIKKRLAIAIGCP